MIDSLTVLEGSQPETVRIDIALSVVEGRCARWAELIEFLRVDPIHTSVLKRETRLAGDALVPSIDPTVMKWGTAEQLTRLV